MPSEYERAVCFAAKGKQYIITLPKAWVLGSNIKAKDVLKILVDKVAVIIPPDTSPEKLEQIKKMLQ